VIGTKWVFKNK
jgi:hypothetical protein